MQKRRVVPLEDDLYQRSILSLLDSFSYYIPTGSSQKVQYHPQNIDLTPNEGVTSRVKPCFSPVPPFSVGRNCLSAPYNKTAQTVAADGRSGPTCQNMMASASRLCEPSPSAHYTHVPTHWPERQVPSAPCMYTLGST